MYDHRPTRSHDSLENGVRIRGAEEDVAPTTGQEMPEAFHLSIRWSTSAHFALRIPSIAGSAIRTTACPLQIRQLLGVLFGAEGIDDGIEFPVHDGLEGVIFLAALQPMIRHTVLREVVRPNLGRPIAAANH